MHRAHVLRRGALRLIEHAALEVHDAALEGLAAYKYIATAIGNTTEAEYAQTAYTNLLNNTDTLVAAYPNADILIHPDPRGLAEKHGGVFAEGVEG